MIIIDVNNQERVTVNSDREAQRLLEGMAEQIRKHPYHLAGAKVKRLESSFDTFNKKVYRNRSRGTFKMELKKAQFEADIKAALEAQALIDPPAKLSVVITKIKTQKSNINF